MNRLLTTVAGSRLYGLSSPTSDVDLKGVYLPSARSILLGTAAPLVSFSPHHGHGVRNTSQDTDATYTSVSQFTSLLGQGQPDVVELVLSPRETSWVESTALGERLVDVLNSDEGRRAWRTRVAARRMLGFARSQVSTFRTKARRLEALNAALALLRRTTESNEANYGRSTKSPVLGDCLTEAQVNAWIVDHQPDPRVDDLRLTHHATDGGWTLVVLGKSVVSTQPLRAGVVTLEHLLSQYSSRSKEAMEKGGVDWKALSHSLRLCLQAKELASTGSVKFPLQGPEVEFVKEVKKGTRDKDEVLQKLDERLKEAEEAVDKSDLPDTADKEWLEELVYKFHLSVVMGEGEVKVHSCS
ncbi:hypothetical protein T439DRAFT_328012 [Meredithblackwellia eburnea MCA 4105]